MNKKELEFILQQGEGQFYNPSSLINSEVVNTLTERQITILQTIQKNPKISRKELADEIKINQSAIQKHLKKLKQEGLLKRVGPAKGGHWEVSE